MNNRRAPTTEGLAGKVEGLDGGILFQQGMNGAAQVTDALSVNNADAQDAEFEALSEVFGHEVLHIPGLERVQVQHAVDWEWDWFVHMPILPRAARGAQVLLTPIEISECPSPEAMSRCRCGSP
jgi:hypothetical protein